MVHAYDSGSQEVMAGKQEFTVLKGSVPIHGPAPPTPASQTVAVTKPFEWENSQDKSAQPYGKSAGTSQEG